jgi:hypothetical protein
MRLVTLRLRPLKMGARVVDDQDREQRRSLILGHSESMDQNNPVCRSRMDDVTLTVMYTIP